MGSKQDPHRSYGQKIITLFVKLLFTRDEYSLGELARQLSCSKQSVLRLLDDLQRAHRLELEERREGNRKYIRLRRPERIPPAMTLSDSEYNLLLMCRDFTAHLLGAEMFAEATRALEKSQALLAGDGRRSTIRCSPCTGSAPRRSRSGATRSPATTTSTPCSTATSA